MKTNVLYFGDNLEILRNREYFPDECVDFTYLEQTSATFTRARRISQKEGEQLAL